MVDQEGEPYVRRCRLVLTDDAGSGEPTQPETAHCIGESPMITLHRCESRLIFLMMIGWGWAAASAAQTVPQQTTPPPSLIVVSGRVPLGAVVHVTDAGGSIVKGSLFALLLRPCKWRSATSCAPSRRATSVAFNGSSPILRERAY